MSAVFVYIVVAVFGLLIGSFLNVVILRVPEGESIVTGGSACPKCAASIAAYDNIPVGSWLILRGRCRSCRTPISPQYPAIEASTALLFVIAVARFGYTWDAAIAGVLLAGLLALAVIDARTLRLPNPIVAVLAIVGVVLVVAAALATGATSMLLDAGISGVGALVVFVAIAEIGSLAAGRQAMGYGDVKLAGVMGLYLGAIAPRYIVVAVLAAFLTGAIAGVVQIGFAGGDRKTRIPFGVFLAVGALISVFVAEPLVGWYLGLGGF